MEVSGQFHALAALPPEENPGTNWIEVERSSQTVWTIRKKKSHLQPIPVAMRSKAWVCGHSVHVIAGSNTAGDVDVSLLWVLCVTVRGPCDEPILHPEESNRMCVCVCVCVSLSVVRRHNKHYIYNE